ncbi:MAG: baseplate J/gp47 family protein [Rhodoblastus sp.]
MARRDEAGPYNLDDLRALPVPALFERDPDALKAQLVTWFEGETGRTLYPMQVEMLLIDMVAYLWSLINTDAQIAHEQRYTTLAELPWLRHLGAQPGIETPPLPAASAVTRIRFSLSSVTPTATLIPAGTRVSGGTDATVFLTDEGLAIAAGATAGVVDATAAVAGVAANGLQPGQVSSLLDPVAGVASAINTVATAGGADAEAADAYRLRLANALEKTSICGQRRGYIEHAMAFSATFVDCAAIRPQPCYVDLYPLTANGAPAATLRAALKTELDRLQAEEILPMGDLVTIKVVESVVMPLRMQLVIATADETIVTAAKAAALQATAPWGLQLAPTVVPQTVRDAVMEVAGVINVETPNFAYQKLSASQRAAIEIYEPIVKVAS